MSEVKYPIADRHNLYNDEIRNSERYKAADKIAEVCREFGIDSLEFPYIMDIVRVEVYEDFEWVNGEDEEEDDTEDNLEDNL